MYLRISFCALVVMLGMSALSASPQQKKKDMLDPKDVPLVVVVKSGKDAYALNLGGKTGKEFLEEIEAAKKAGKRIAEPPAVDLVIEVKNTGKIPIDFWTSGDPVEVNLELKGPGAATVRPPLAFTADFRGPNFTTLEPGKTHTIKLTNLRSGFRGASTYHYWTEPGEYTLTAKLKTGVRPVPPGVQEAFGGARVTLVSEPIKVLVK
jgi:hypothetical protein